MISVGLDSNILAYLAGVDRVPEDAEKIAEARRILGRLSGKARCVAPIQALGELVIVLIRSGASRIEARDIALRFEQNFQTADSNTETLITALDLIVAHKLQFWDATIINACANAGCTMLLSEDMQDGFVWRGITITNPFLKAGRARMLAAIK
jgi:predicted nucleic acid-binding protein